MLYFTLRSNMILRYARNLNESTMDGGLVGRVMAIESLSLRIRVGRVLFALSLFWAG